MSDDSVAIHQYHAILAAVPGQRDPERYRTNQSGTVNQDSCYGFLFDDYVDEYESTHYLLPCDSRDYVDIRHTTEDDTIPLPGEFPLADFQHVDCSISCCVKPVLTEPSFRALCALSDEGYSHWWGIGTTYTDRSSSKDPDEVSIRSGLSHFRDIIMAVEHNQEECGAEGPLVCPMSCIAPFVCGRSVVSVLHARRHAPSHRLSSQHDSVHVASSLSHLRLGVSRSRRVQ